MKQMQKINYYILIILATLGLIAVFPVAAQASNVGWNVSVGGGYGGGWRPAAYGPGWGPGWRGGWAYGGGYYGAPYGYPYAAYYTPPVAYVPPPQPMVLAAQPQPAVWYFCEATNQYFPYAQECASGWQAQAAIPPSGGVKSSKPAQ